MWALVNDDEVVRVFHKPEEFRDRNGILHTPAIFQYWTNEELAAIGVFPAEITNIERPSRFHIRSDDFTFQVENDKVLLAYVYVLPELEDIKQQALEIVNNWKVSKQDGLFQYDGYDFQCDPRSREFITGAALDAYMSVDDPNFVQPFTDANNNTHEFSALQMIAMAKAAKANVEYWHMEALIKKASITFAETFEDVLAIVEPLLEGLDG